MRMPQSVAEFLAGKRFAVAGVSRDPRQVVRQCAEPCVEHGARIE
jgi:hypothetical protein